MNLRVETLKIIDLQGDIYLLGSCMQALGKAYDRFLSENTTKMCVPQETRILDQDLKKIHVVLIHANG